MSGGQVFGLPFSLPKSLPKSEALIHGGTPPIFIPGFIITEELVGFFFIVAENFDLLITES